ncbi:bifunctional diaminohydroxyphosphoribosylaminopyrimidine deaminase/5-amino-6-(5-phosphoribosylamino)uracil reductase RibD [Sanguibacter antarcticus]|uniref:Riboflavin biosynthesis protein RibD n=1 Tax=Sanguibacter antarcticus TaxID=372484 RepID=A0A2A9E443_9MICO|nr:bifunctional diaminohydroxyphosphoribosylaminopyrimidine deaminase/5-amino-6-(5-phosphoribosylamino)uracil reductase RibD [Sanguibacter antarcticus]PFG33125.1 diaminohydroxyphosphoribosylaminopyrimidine deaminase/5-amino-6-(5-phosphoribosylamino)uracil reductase [Sanguibacter antarcticus]
MDANRLTVESAMRRALDLAARGPVHGPNPQVGCVLLAPSVREDDVRAVLAEGWHRGAGTAHAEVDALAQAAKRGVDVRGATAVVSLEPCNHVGRTGPCSVALVAASVVQVVYAVADPNPSAAGGAEHLRAHGVAVRGGLLADEGEELLRIWLTSARRGTPYVTLKTATSLDGCVAAADGSSRWITGSAAREHAHEVRAGIDAIAVGTGTLLADDPSLTARTPHGALAVHQPLRVVVGEREIPTGARIHGPGGEVVHVRSRDIHDVLAVLGARDVRHLLVEGGPALATAFLRAGAVDELHSYVAPMLVGSGRRAVTDLGGRSLDDALRFRTVHTRQLGDDVLVVSRAHPAGAVVDRAKES